MVCCGMLTSTTTGPSGETRGFHQYSPGFSGPVGLPVGEPFVWNDGCVIEAATASDGFSVASVMRAAIRSFDFIEWFRISVSFQRSLDGHPLDGILPSR